MFNEGMTDVMVATILGLSVETVSTVHWTLSNIITLLFEALIGQHEHGVAEEWKWPENIFVFTKRVLFEILYEYIF